MGKKVIDRMLTAEVKNRCLRVRFEGGPTASWQLPERWRAVVGTILYEAKSFAMKNGATLDQINDIEKALRIVGYSYLTKKQRDDYLKKRKGLWWLDTLCPFSGSRKRR